MTIGSTGKFPLGQITDDDEGELNVGIAVDQENKSIHVRFGKTIAWLAFPPDHAREIAQILITKAIEITSSYTPAWRADGIISFYSPNDSDVIELKIEIGSFNGQVKIDFAPEQSSFALSGIMMILLANTIIRKAAEIDGQVYTIKV